MLAYAYNLAEFCGVWDQQFKANVGNMAFEHLFYLGNYLASFCEPWQ